MPIRPIKLTCLFVILGLSGCDTSPTAQQAPAPTEVGIVTLKAQPFNLVSELTGRTTATLTADVRPQVGGIIQKRLATWKAISSGPVRRCIRLIPHLIKPLTIRPPPR